MPIEISIRRGNWASLKVNKTGTGGKTLSNKKALVAKFIYSHLDFEYIPAVRTEEEANSVVSSMVARVLSQLEEEPKYKKAMKKLSDIRAPFLRDVSKKIQNTLVKFLPQVKNVEILVGGEAEEPNCSMLIDDGVLTDIEYKGDGVKSLAALSLMRTQYETSGETGLIVLAIEEPESHLHPNAIHEVKKVLLEMSKRYQIILTTHNPIFIKRDNISSNIIVNKNKAEPAKNLKEIRDILGVKVADNLTSASLVLVVEGGCDKKVLSVIFRNRSDMLRKAMEDGDLIIDFLGGAQKLPYKLSMLRDAICKYHVYLDYDTEGLRSYDKSSSEGLMELKDATFAIVSGMQESEFEDIYNKSVYQEVLESKYGIDLSTYNK